MKKLLIVVDYQNDFIDGALGFPGAEKLSPIRTSFSPSTLMERTTLKRARADIFLSLTA